MDDNAISATQKAMFTSLGTWSLGWLTSVDWLAIISAIVLVGTAIGNWYFRRRKDRREQERHDLEMANLRRDSQQG